MLIQPLLVLVTAQALLALLLCAPLKPIRSAATAVLSPFKQPVGRVAAQTLALGLLVILGFSAVNVRRLLLRLARYVDAGTLVAAEDRHELMQDALQCSLIAASLLLMLLLEQLSAALRSCELLQLSIDTLKKQAKGLQDEYMRLQEESKAAKAAASASGAGAGTVAGEGAGGKGGEGAGKGDVHGLQELVARLERRNRALQEEVEVRKREVRTADANVAAIKKQTEGLQLSYSQMMEENESLRSQLAIFDRKYKKSDEKKRM